MVGANVKQETMVMMEKRTEIERELQAIIARLSLPNGAGLTGNLVDKDGFPRADIDIPAVRSDRQRLSVLRNDYKDITSKIEQNLHVLHSTAAFGKDSALPQKRTADGVERSFARQDLHLAGAAAAAAARAHAEGEETVHMDEDVLPRLVPFAVFDQIAAGSPAAQDGLLLGDMLVKFGSVEGAGEGLLQRLATEGQLQQGKALNIVVIRSGVPVHLSLVPRPWSGYGLLGCHVRPL